MASWLCHEKHKIPIDHRARRIRATDFTSFTHILASDSANVKELKQLRPEGTTAEIALWGSYDDNKPISDPYYGGAVSSLRTSIIEMYRYLRIY